MECLLWSLSLVYTPHSLQSTSGQVARILLKSCELNRDCSFDTTFFFSDDFWFLIEYPFKWNIPTTVICTNVPPIPRAICLTHARLDSEKIKIFRFWGHIFTTNDFRFLIEYSFKSNIPITVIYTHVCPIPSANCLTHACPDSEKIEPNRDFSFSMTHFSLQTTSESQVESSQFVFDYVLGSPLVQV